CFVFFFFQAEDGIRDFHVTGVQTCALPIFLTEKSSITASAFLRLGDGEDVTTNNTTNFNNNIAEEKITRIETESEDDTSYQFSLDRKSVRVGKECRSR